MPLMENIHPNHKIVLNSPYLQTQVSGKDFPEIFEKNNHFTLVLDIHFLLVSVKQLSFFIMHRCILKEVLRFILEKSLSYSQIIFLLAEDA